MKILLLADEAEPMLWEHLNKSRLEGIDLMLSCGDLPAAYLSFLTCFTAAPILYIHGNHDDRYKVKPPEGCICIEDSLYVHKGVRILGLGGCMRYKPGENQYTDPQMAKRARKLRFTIWRHGGVDILLTHAPAYHLGDDGDLSAGGRYGPVPHGLLVLPEADGQVSPQGHGPRPCTQELYLQFCPRARLQRDPGHQCIWFLRDRAP